MGTKFIQTMQKKIVLQHSLIKTPTSVKTGLSAGAATPEARSLRLLTASRCVLFFPAPIVAWIRAGAEVLRYAASSARGPASPCGHACGLFLFSPLGVSHCRSGVEVKCQGQKSSSKSRSRSIKISPAFCSFFVQNLEVVNNS